MNATIEKKGSSTCIHDDNVIPDVKNIFTCLYCKKAVCKGNCDKISNKRGRVKEEMRYAR